MNQNVILLNGLYTKKCAVCDNLVKQQKYKSHVKNTCSPTCSNVLKWKTRSLLVEYVSLDCKHCGQKFKLLKSIYNSRKRKGNTPTFCTRKCSDNYGKNINICKICGNSFYPKQGRKTIKTCGKKCQYTLKKYTLGQDGTWYENGYIVEYNGTKNGIKQHRRIMQDYLGRELTNNEVVHHINGVRDDNRLENLQLTTHSEHSSHHRIEEYKNGLLPFRKKSEKTI